MLLDTLISADGLTALPLSSYPVRVHVVGFGLGTLVKFNIAGGRVGVLLDGMDEPTEFVFAAVRMVRS